MDFDPRDYNSRDEARSPDRDLDSRDREFDPRDAFTRDLNITDEELRKALTGVWERRRQLKAVGDGRPNADAQAVGE